MQSILLPNSGINLLNSGRRICKWCCIRRPYWYINPIVSLVSNGLTDKEIPLKSSKVEARIFNSVASIKYSQTYVNNEKVPLEWVYKFPADPYFTVTGMHITLDDKEIDAVIMEKEEAKEKYDDAVAAGDTAAKINYDENIPDVIELSIGAIQPDKKVKIEVSMVAKCDVIKHGYYSFIFPINFIPKYNPTRADKISQPSSRGNWIPGKFSCNIIVESTSEISDLSVSHKGMKYVQSDDGKKVTITLEKAKDVFSKDIVISYSTEEIRAPSVVLHQSTKHPNEVAAHISFIPRISDEHEEEEVKEEVDEDVKEKKVVSDIDDKDDPDIASGEFIFVLDRSGSMKGNRITTAIEALKLFVQSLPSDSKFNIVSFGTKFEFMYKTSQKYEKKIVDQTFAKLNYFKANMQGTEMLKPMEAIFKLKNNPKYPRNVFLLTDGAIGNTDEVVSKIRKFNYSTRVHTFGIGSGASAYLVKETAKAGLGTSAMIADNDPKIKEKVIQALKIAAKPAFTDIKVDWKSNSNALEFQCPRPPISGNIYEEESFDIYAIFSKKDLIESDIELSFFNTFNQDKGSVTLHIDPTKIVDAGDDDCAFKMAAKENIIHLKRSAEEGKEPSAEILGLSLMYSVLCDQTAFFGKIKNKEKSTEEMKTIKIPIKKYRDNAISKAPVFYGGYHGGIMKKSYAFEMERWAAAAPSMMKCKTLSMNTAMSPQSAALERKHLQKRSRKPEAAMWKKEIWRGMLSILYFWSFCYYSS